MAQKKRVEYRAASGAGYTDKQAQIIGKTLESLGETISPPEIVQAAKAPLSPLHPFFEWDDVKAAVGYRLQQARRLVNHLEVVVVDKTSGEKSQIKAYYSQQVETVDDDNESLQERRYIHVNVVAASPVLSQNAIESAKAELLGWKTRYERYRKHFAPVFDAISKLK